MSQVLPVIASLESRNALSNCASVYLSFRPVTTISYTEFDLLVEPSSSSMMLSEKLTRELQTLRCVVAAHRMLIDRAVDALDSAIESACIPVKNGFYVIDLKREGWRYPSIQAAQANLEALREDSGFYWTESRISDLERLLGLGFTRQLPFAFATMVVPANPAVEKFVREAA